MSSAVTPARAAGGGGRWWREWGNTCQFALAFGVVNLHELRQLASLPYLAAYAAVFVWLTVTYLRLPKRGVLADRGFGFLAWLGMALWGLADSFVTISRGGALTGLIRWCYAAPVFAALVCFTRSRRELVRNIAVMVGFYTVAALTQPLQLVTGPISWFPTPALRGDVVRYASLLGSLTTIGIIVGCYLLLTLLLPSRWRWPLIALMIVPAVTSTSKSGMVNIALALLVVLWCYRRDRRVLASVVGLGVAGLAGALAWGKTRRFLLVIVDSLRGQGDVAGASDNANLFQNVLGRLFELPSDQWITMAHASSVAPRIIGAGFGMGNTGLVPPADALSEMAHNQLVEVIAIFGAVGGVLVVALCGIVQATLVRLWRRTGDRLYGVIAAMFALFLLNSMFASGTLFQPATASIFYLGCFVALSTRVRDDSLARVYSAPRCTRGQQGSFGALRTENRPQHPAVQRDPEYTESVDPSPLAYDGHHTLTDTTQPAPSAAAQPTPSRELPKTLSERAQRDEETHPTRTATPTRSVDGTA